MSLNKTKNSTTSQSPAVFEYNRNGKYLNILMPASMLRVEKAFLGGKNTPIITFFDPKHENKLLWVVGIGKIGMLADYLGMQRNKMRNLIGDGDAVAKINKLLEQQGDRLIKIDASEYETVYENNRELKMGVFNIATDQHHTITFTEIRECVKSVLGEITETNFNRSLVWEKQLNAFETEVDKFDVKIRITSGRNIKTSAIKVIVYIRIGSCNNTAICANFTSIKHTEGWHERLVKTLQSALENGNAAREVIEMGCKKALTFEEGIDFINNKLNVSITTEENIKRLKEALICRFEYEYSRNKNMFGLSQALSFGGTYFLPDQLSERTLEMLSEQAFEVLKEGVE